MKKFTLVCMLAIVSVAVNKSNAIEEVTVTGTPYPNPADYLGIHPLGNGSSNPQYMYSIQLYYAELAKQRAEQEKIAKDQQIKQCIANAGGAGYMCRNAYQSLGSWCSGLNSLAFAGGGTSVKMLLGKLSKEASAAFGVAQSGAALFGASEDDTLIPCSKLTEKAMSFCEAGAKKMAAECK